METEKSPLGFRLTILLTFEWMHLNGKNISDMNIKKTKTECTEWVQRVVQEIHEEIEDGK